MADFANPFGIEYRVVNEIEHLGQPAHCVSGTRLYDTNVDDLWDAITNAERIPNWFLPISGDLKRGGRYQLQGNAGGEITCCDPPKALDVTWEYANNISWVTVRLEPQGDSTRLTLQHIMGKDEASEEHWKKFGPGATGVGWDLGFLGLGMHLRDRQAIDQAESFAWMGSEQGKTFIRQCAAAWGEAHIAAGESSDTANLMAEQTAKAFCGEI